VTQSDTYDFNTGLCVTSTDANGRTSQTTYFAQTLRPQVEYTPTGAYTSNAYDESAMSISETTFAASGAVAAQKVSFLDGLGNVRREEALTEGGAWDVVEARLDALGRLWRQTRPYRNGQEQPQWNVFTFDALSRVTRVQAPDGSETNMFYNEASRPDAATPGLPGETMRMVDSWGRERWRLTDAHKRLAEVVEPNPAGNGSVATGGLLTRYSYDGLDKLTAITQGNQQRSFRFDALGRMTHQKLSEASPTLNDSGQFVGAGSWSEVSTYDERSNLTSRTDARGVKTVFAYNADPLNRIQSISYDTSGFGDTGNPIVAAPTITYEYLTTGDVRRTSRLTTSGVSTEDFTFDVEGRVNSKTVTLALRPSYPMITDYIYDSLNRLTDVRYPAEYGYGGAPRKVVHHNFDVASRLSSVQVDGVNYASQVQYNAGSLVTSLNVGTNQVTESYTYDAATGFITGQKVQRGGTTLLDLGYDYLRPNTSTGRTSQLTRISNNLDHNKDRGYSYDALGRLAQATGGASMWTENYAYDRYGNRTSVTSSGYAAVTNPPYCTPTQVLGVDPFVRNFYQGALNRQPNTPELQYWGNLLRQAYAQGQQRLLAACQSFGWALFQSQEYANRFRSDRDYVYDLYWAYLQRAPDQGGWDFWTGQVAANGRDQVRRAFDVSGEFANKVGTLCPWATGVPIPRDGLAAVSYDVTSNRINTPGFAYDAAGNQTRVLRSDGSWQRFQYDAGGRLANVKNDNGLVLAVYTYGTRNRRLITQDGESGWNLRTYYAWDGEDVVAEYTESNASPFAPQWSKSYVFLYDRLLATLQPGAGSEYVQYDHPDRLGTSLISNASDTNVQEQVTLPFGTALDAESTGVLKKRFTSYDRGSTTGLDYAINRHYDPQQGRFTQVDPIGMDSASLVDPQSFNMYAYCGNDPINRVDPDGQFWGKLFKGLLKIFKIFNKIIKIIAIAAVVALGVALAATGLGAIAFAKIAFLVAKVLFGVLKFISTAISAIAGKIAGIFKFAAFAFAEGGTKAGLSGLGLLQALGAIEKQIAKRQSRQRKRRREIERKRIEIILKDAKAIMDALTEQARKLLCKTQGERNCQIQWSIDMGKAEEQNDRTLGGCSTPWCVWYANKEYERAKARIGDEEGKCLFELNDKCGTRWP
jgi:RHS repeat-associated protein